MYRKDKDFILDIIEACERILNYTKNLSYEDFFKNSEKQDAVIRNIEIIGEAVKHLSDEVKNKYGEIDWKSIAGMRDKLIHFYFGLNLEIVWKVIEKEIPKLKNFIKEIIGDFYDK